MKLSHSLAILSRRKWIKLFLLGAVARAATSGRRCWRRSSEQRSALIPIRLSQFPELNETGGSIALYFSNFRLPLVVTRGEGNDFYAMDSTCTHAGCQVNNYSSLLVESAPWSANATVPSTTFKGGSSKGPRRAI